MKRILAAGYKPTSADILSAYHPEAAWKADVKVLRSVLRCAVIIYLAVDSPDFSISSVTLETPLPSGDCIPATPSLAVFFVSLGNYDGPAEDNDTRKQLLALRRFLNSPLGGGRRILVALSFSDVFHEKITKIDPKCAFADYSGTVHNQDQGLFLMGFCLFCRWVRCCQVPGVPEGEGELVFQVQPH